MLVAFAQNLYGVLSNEEHFSSDGQKKEITVSHKKAVVLQKAQEKFKEAKYLYSNEEYLKATDALLDLIASYPNYELPKRLYKKIANTINKIISESGELDFEKITYAKAYVAYYNANYKEALNQWSKYTSFTGGTKEVKEYSEKVDGLLKVEQFGRNRKIDLNEQAKKMLEGGIKKYNSKEWIQCIKEMEKLVNFMMKNGLSKTLNCYVKAKEYISKSLTELSKTLAVKDKMIVDSDVYREGKSQCNEVIADEKYKDGLALYAGGKYYEAERLWELTLRLNPNHQKAKIALSKLKNSTTE
ncbi:MAG: hypothetical protein LBU29_03725 [Endomicrobium sp.]|nr:hypothetical protein [Endomicrobium sp.]